MSDEIVIDGSRGEGGGQMLRTSLAMSAITGRPLVMENIRAKRSKPGLARQHLSGLLLMKEICSARVEGDSVGSTRVEFAPDAIRHGQYSMDVGTAGSVTLVLQTVLPALASVKGCSEILLTGGTDVRWAPPVDYYRLVLFPMLERVGVRCALEVVQRGYFPQGGGRVKLTISSEGLFKSFDMPDFDRPDVISGIVNITGLPPRIAERIRDSALEALP